MGVSHAASPPPTQTQIAEIDLKWLVLAWTINVRAPLPSLPRRAAELQQGTGILVLPRATKQPQGPSCGFCFTCDAVSSLCPPSPPLLGVQPGTGTRGTLLRPFAAASRIPVPGLQLRGGQGGPELPRLRFLLPLQPSPHRDVVRAPPEISPCSGISGPPVWGPWHARRPKLHVCDLRLGTKRCICICTQATARTHRPHAADEELWHEIGTGWRD